MVVVLSLCCKDPVCCIQILLVSFSRGRLYLHLLLSFSGGRLYLHLLLSFSRGRLSFSAQSPQWKALRLGVSFHCQYFSVNIFKKFYLSFGVQNEIFPIININSIADNLCNKQKRACHDYYITCKSYLHAAKLFCACFFPNKKISKRKCKHSIKLSWLLKLKKFSNIRMPLIFNSVSSIMKLNKTVYKNESVCQVYPNITSSQQNLT